MGGMPQNQHKSLEWSESSGKGNSDSERPCLTCGPWQPPSPAIGWGEGSPSLSWMKHFRCEQLSSRGPWVTSLGVVPPPNLKPWDGSRGAQVQEKRSATQRPGVTPPLTLKKQHMEKERAGSHLFPIKVDRRGGDSC